MSKDIPSAQIKLVGYACFFASVFTFSLFLYEIRGMLRHSMSLENEENCLQLVDDVASKTSLRRREGMIG